MGRAVVSHAGDSEAPLRCLPVDFFKAGEIPARPEVVPDVGNDPLDPGFITGLITSGGIDDETVVMC